MTSTAPAPGFEHLGLLHEGDRGFVDAVVPYVADGLRAGEVVVAAVIPHHIELLRDTLGADADGVVFEDMTRLGTNPARIIGEWERLRGQHQQKGRGLRAIGEPVWAGRTPDEVAECAVHEHLLNRAFADGPAWTLLCPYDTETLDPPTLRSVARHHPNLLDDLDGHRRHASDHYGVDDILRSPLPAVPPGAVHVEVDAAPTTLIRARAAISEHPAVDRLSADQVDVLQLTISELASNAVRHGGGHGELDLWCENDRVVVQVRDTGGGCDPLMGRRKPGPGPAAGRGLWLVNQLCDLVQFRTGPDGTTVRAHLEVSPARQPGGPA